MQIFNFLVLSVIIAPHNVLTPRISKTHLRIVSLNIRKLKLNDGLKTPVKEKGRPACVEDGSPTPPAKP